MFLDRPWLAAMLALSLLSLAGIPVTAGFIGKFYAIAAGVDAGLWWLVLALIANSVVRPVLYLQLFVTLWYGSHTGNGYTRTGGPRRRVLVNWTTICSLGFVASIILALGVYPEPLIRNSSDVLSAICSWLLCRDHRQVLAQLSRFHEWSNSA